MEPKRPKRLDELPDVLTRDEVCAVLRLSWPTVDALRRSGRLPPLDTGSSAVRWSKAVIQAYLEAQVRHGTGKGETGV